MCWSPTADLVAGAGVGAIGAVVLVQVRRLRDLPMACLPLLLGAHQLIESVVWRGADGEASPGATHLAALLWTAIAFPLLPAFVPLAVLCAIWPQRAARRRVLPLCALGLASSGMLAYAMVSGPVSVVPMGHVLTYGLRIPADSLVISAYVAATLATPVISGDRDLCRFGLTAAVGAAVCITAWRLAFASTWCAFAALTSLALIPWVRRERIMPARGEQHPGSILSGYLLSLGRNTRR